MKTNIKEKQYFNQNNVTGLIANLYFTDLKRMNEEMPGEKIDVKKMLAISTKLFKKYFPNTDVLYILMYLDIQQVVKAERCYYLCFIEWGKI